MSRKERFQQMMEEGRKKDAEKLANNLNAKGDLLIVEENNHKTNGLLGPEPQPWEQNIWSDVLQDTNGNLLKQKENKETGEIDWEIVSSESVKMRRKL